MVTLHFLYSSGLRWLWFSFWTAKKMLSIPKTTRHSALIGRL